jgi:hypothetical protein
MSSTSLPVDPRYGLRRWSIGAVLVTVVTAAAGARVGAQEGGVLYLAIAVMHLPALPVLAGAALAALAFLMAAKLWT